MLVLDGVLVNFLYSGWYGAMLWIHAGHRVDKIEMFFVIAKQDSHRAKPFLVLILLTRKVWLHGMLGGDTSRTGDSN